MNAIKYTDPGGYYKVTLSMDKGVAPPMVKISCTDSGRGMSEEFLKYGLWQAFKQEDSHTPGTGLGLSLVRSLVHEMGGTISLKSVKDVGTTIKLCLPLTAGNPSDVHNLRDLTESVQIKGLTFSLMGFRTTSPLPRVAEASGVQRSSIDKACKYLGLVSFDEQTKRGRSADILIITERAARRLAESGEAKVQASHAKACLVFCDSVTAARAAGPLCKSLIREASAVSQPCGPQQLLRALVACLDKYSHAANQDSLPGIRIKTNEDHATAIPKALVSRLVPSKGAVKVSASIEITARPLTRKAEPISDSSVLLVDDNPINLTLLRRSIKRLGRIDLCATNGQEALLAYKESHAQPLSQARRLNGKPTKTAPVRFILTDITMPVMDGLEFTRRVRAHERALDLKPAMIVALTALSSPAARQEAFGSGVDLFLSKPFTQKQIAAIFADWELDQSEDGE
jgi:CheY-like chemotaxis protein